MRILYPSVTYFQAISIDTLHSSSRVGVLSPTGAYVTSILYRYTFDSVTYAGDLHCDHLLFFRVCMLVHFYNRQLSLVRCSVVIVSPRADHVTGLPLSPLCIKFSLFLGQDRGDDLHLRGGMMAHA